MIPRQVDEPEPERDKWAKYDDSKRKHHYAAGAWPEVTDTNAVTDRYINRLLRQAEQTGFTYNGLGALYQPPYFDAIIERQRARAYQARQRTARQEHKRRMARLAELIRTS
jgi:hypothetical protein